MATFKKTILRPGTYVVSVNGKRKSVTFTKDDVKNRADTAKQMLADGLLIPAPFGHVDQKGIHPVPLFKEGDELVDARDKKRKPAWDHAVNAGFWTDFSIDDQGALVGTVEVDDDYQDQIGKTVKQVSPFFLPEFTDGLGKVRKDALLHVCLTNSAVQPAQDNFQPVDQELAIAMSVCEADMIGGVSLALDEEKVPSQEKPSSKASSSEESKEGSDKTGDEVEKAFGNKDRPVSEDKLSQVLVELKNRLEITLPEDTDDSNFLDRLLTVLLNREEEEGDGLPDVDDEPDPKKEGNKSASDDPTPLVMAQNADADKKLNALIGLALSAKKKELKERVAAMVRTGKVGRAQADKVLVPAIDALAMSNDDLSTTDAGEVVFPQFPIEMSLAVLDGNETLTEETTSEETLDGDIPEETEDMEEKGTVSQKDATDFIANLLP